jgi:hypothetical protein
VSGPLDPHINVERPAPDRLIVTIERRQRRMFSLSDSEAAYLAELLRIALARGGAG